MDRIASTARIVRRPDGSYVARWVTAPGCLGTGPSPTAASQALREALQDFPEPAITHCPQVRISVLVDASRVGTSGPPKRASRRVHVGCLARTRHQ